MSAIINPQPLPVGAPHMFTRCSPPRMVGRKRKADGEHEDRHSFTDDGDSMDHSQTFMPSGVSSRSIAHPIRGHKRLRANITGRALPLSRLLETVDQNTLKSLLQTMCDRHPELIPELTSLAPRPTMATALSTLEHYEENYRNTFPYGGGLNDYSYNRVRPALADLLDALSDYTPNFLPPHEMHTSTSLSFLDAATSIIHRLPDWENPINNHSKQSAYEEITKAWVLVIQEAAKKGAGIGLQYGAWDSKIYKHDEQSGGRMGAAAAQVRETVGWLGESGKVNKYGGLGFGMHSGVGMPVRSW